MILRLNGLSRYSLEGVVTRSHLRRSETERRGFSGVGVADAKQGPKKIHAK